MRSYVPAKIGSSGMLRVMVPELLRVAGWNPIRFVLLPHTVVPCRCVKRIPNTGSLIGMCAV